MGLGTELATKMNTKSIRFRILVLYSLALFIATAVIFSSFYLVTREILFTQVDQELNTHATKLTEIITSDKVSMQEITLKQQLYREFSEMPGMVVVLIDKDGKIVRSSLTANNPDDAYGVLFKEIKQGAPFIYKNQDIGGSPMRIIAKPVFTDSNFTGVVLVAHPVDVIQKSLDILLTTLGAVFALLLFPTVLGGYFLARRAMKPITQISDKMKLISSEHLSERVDSPHTNDELEKLTSTFNRLLDRLQDSFQRERQFIGDVAHELKTPIATLKSGVELTLSKNRTSKEYKETLEETMIDINRLSSLTKNILDLALVGAENAQTEEKPFSLSETVAEIKDIAVKLALQKKIIIKGKIKADIYISGSQDKIYRAIFNIVDNAIKYTKQGGKVVVNLYKNKTQAVVEVTDTGVGIAEKDLDHIFERFYRGSKTAKTLGSGLGLAIASGIIKTHHGEIKVKSKVGEGATFIVTLPTIKKSS